MFTSRFDDVPYLTTHARAAAHEAAVKPIRGRSTECKPLGKRSKTHVNIRKEGENILCRLYHTDVLTFRPDDRMIVTLGGWATQTTLGFIYAVSGLTVSIQYGRVWVSAHVMRDGELQFGAFPLDPNRENVFSRQATELGTGWVFENPDQFQVHKINRKGANTVRKLYRAFRDYIVQTMRLRDNGFSPEEFGEMFGWQSEERRGTHLNLPAVIRVREGCSAMELQRSIAEFLALTEPTTDVATRTTNFYKASLILAHSSGAWWGNACRPTEFSMLKVFDDAVLYNYKHQCFNEMSAEFGKITRDAYARFF